MKRLVPILSMVLAVGLLGSGCSDVTAPADEVLPESSLAPLSLTSVEPQSVEFPLTTVRGRQVGTIEVVNDATTLRVMLRTTGEWAFRNTHLAIARSVEGIERGRFGQPRLMRFPFHARHRPPAREHEIVIDLAEHGLSPGDDVVLAVHVIVAQPGKRGILRKSRSAWARGEAFPRWRLAAYVTVTLQTFEVPVPPEEPEDPPEDPPEEPEEPEQPPEDPPEEPEEPLITVLLPNGLEWVCENNYFNIRWLVGTGASDYVRIELLRDGSFCQLIIDSTLNTGAYRWSDIQICGDPTEDRVYTIRITDLGSGFSDDSDEPFKIAPCAT